MMPSTGESAQKRYCSGRANVQRRGPARVAGHREGLRATGRACFETENCTVSERLLTCVLITIEKISSGTRNAKFTVSFSACGGGGKQQLPSKPIDEEYWLERAREVMLDRTKWCIPKQSG